MDNNNNTITNSSISTFKSCRQKYYWSYELGWRPDRDKAPLRIGSMVHEGLDMLAKGNPLDYSLNAIAMAYAMAQDDEQVLQYELVTVQELIRGYYTAWANSEIKIIESEKTFDLPITNPSGNAMTALRQRGKRDRLCELPDGRTAIMETKTVGQDIGPDSDYRRVLSINQQLSMYIAAAQAEGHDVDTAIYDCIRKPTIRPCAVPLTDGNGDKIVVDADGRRIMKANGQPRQSADTAKGYLLQTRDMTPEEWRSKLASDILERPDYYYQRFEVPRMHDDLEAFRVELWMVAKDIIECHRMKRWYRNTNACRQYNSLCSYYPLCAGERDLSNGCPDGYRQAETVHEELADESA